MKKLSSIELVLSSNDLASQVNEIHNAPISDFEKRRAFIEIGLCNDDLRSLYGDRYIRPARPLIINANGRGLTFGVEIECLVPRTAIARTAQENGVRIAYEGYNHTDNTEYYKFVTDSSITDENGSRPVDGIECVSPILHYDGQGLESLKKATDALVRAGARVNKSTGLHVHIGAQNLTGEQIVRVYKNYQRLEDLIDSFMAPSRRSSRWAQSLRGYDFTYCSNAHDVTLALHHDRYHKVNPCSYGRHTTIEFRQHGGSVNYEKISKWVSFCAKLVAFSMTREITPDVTSIEDIPFLNDAEKRFFNARAEHFITEAACA